MKNVAVSHESAAARSPLAHRPADERNKLFPIVAQGAQVVEELTGLKKHWRTVLRWAERKQTPKLQSAVVGQTRCTTREWLMQFWMEAADANGE